MVQRLPSKTVAYTVSVLPMDTGCFSGRCLRIGRDAKVSSTCRQATRKDMVQWRMANFQGNWQAVLFESFYVVM